MSDLRKKGLHIAGKKRRSDLVSYMVSLGTRGMRKAQIRSVASAYNEQVIEPAFGSEAFEASLKEAWARLADENEKTPFKDLHMVETKKAEFLIYPYFPKGAVTILDGDPGMGKSLVTTHLGAMISIGGKFANIEKVPKGRVLFLSPEDEADRILRPRLEAHRADVKQIRFMNDHFLLDVEGVELLRRELRQHRPEIVIVDPLSAFVSPKIQTSQANEVRGFMRPLAALASEFDIAILIVRHIRKAAAESAIQMGQGSMDFIAAVRSGLFIAENPADPASRILAHSKANWSVKGSSLTFEVVGGGRDSIPALRWGGFSDLTANDLANGGGRKEKAEDACASVITEILARGPMKAKKAIKMLKLRDYSERTIDRAKTIAGVISGRGPGAEWKLP